MFTNANDSNDLNVLSKNNLYNFKSHSQFIIDNVSPSKDPTKSPIIKGVKGADAGGAAGGAFLGAIGGSIVPGAGTFAGMALGAITVSSATSIGKVVENVWNYFFGEN